MPTPCEAGAKSDLVVSVGESQLIRWIDELNGRDDVGAQIKTIKNKIRSKKKSKEKSKTKSRIKALYSELNELKFIPDLVSVVMNRESHYDEVNRGFTINFGLVDGKEVIIKYSRLLGTPNAIKKGTILYINEKLYPEIMRRIENGRNKEKELVAAKLEAYRALTCSGSLPVPKPTGIIVVNDCITKFKEDVIVIRDSDESDEPILTNEKDFEIEHNNSDGFGLMLPSYAAKVNQHLSGDTTPLSGMVIRYSFTKGMLVSFDFVEFAEKSAHNYIVKDVWGNPQDVRNAEVILTESMLKLWDSYDSWEDYEQNCIDNGYNFAVTKTCPIELENEHDTNYQFLNPLDFTNEEIKELCQPTLTQIKNVMADDYRQAIVYLTGGNLNEDSSIYKTDNDGFGMIDNYVTAALMIGGQAEMNDPFVRQRINANIAKQIERAERGKIIINANYAMIVGDPYALAQSMFNLPVVGLLTKGEAYHKHWIDKGAREIACFRAPMSVANNIRKLKLNQSDQAAYWFKHIKTVCVLNAWDSTCEAENGADFDGDTFYCTDNPLIIAKAENLPTIISIQNKAPKIVPTETDIIEANKLAFNDEIGSITNIITEMYDLLTRFDPNSDEYKTLEYRIKCGQHLQQASIDKAKGAQTKPMPESWRRLKRDGKYTDVQRAIVADKKPYFFKYVYPKLKKQYDDNKNRFLDNVERKNGETLQSLIQTDNNKADLMLENFAEKIDLTNYDCTVNRICRYIEQEMQDFAELKMVNNFDYGVLKSNIKYSKNTYNKIAEIYQNYKYKMKELTAELKTAKRDNDFAAERKQEIQNKFIEDCDLVCPNPAMLADIVVDMVYGSKGSKEFAWLVCGEQLIDNLLKNNDGKIEMPIRSDDDFDFEFGGEKYKVIEKVIENDEKHISD